MLLGQLQQMQSAKDLPGISCGLVDNNVFEWEVMLMISDDVKLYGGKLHASDFRKDLITPQYIYIYIWILTDWL